MNGFSEEQKIKILYEDSLREIHAISEKLEKIGKRVEVAARMQSEREHLLCAETERLLSDAVRRIESSASHVLSLKDGLISSTEGAVLSLLAGQNGPLREFERLIRRQQEALGWISRATNQVEHSYFTRPMILSALIGSSLGTGLGIVVGIIYVHGACP